MYDITQFVLIIPIVWYNSTIIVQYFMQDVLMKFGLWYLVVIDDSISFKCVFTSMCTCLQIKFEIVFKCNHKGIWLYQFYWALNKVVTIASNATETIDIFAEAWITAVYA